MINLQQNDVKIDEYERNWVFLIGNDAKKFNFVVIS